jgi:hypothetical protein
MLFTETKSALVRLSDSIKDILNECLILTEKILSIYEKNSAALEDLKSIARESLADDNKLKDFDETAKRIVSKIPMEESLRGAELQRILHSQALQVVLTSCFALESYINSLAYYLFKQEDYLGLIRDGHETTADILLTSIDNMRVMEKWEALGKFNTGNSFDKSQAPFQNCKIIFNFRNDIVHDKVINYSDKRVTKRYNSLLPDPVFGMLDLAHANFAANTYWEMIIEIHALLNYDMKKFHRNYNLMPWFDKTHCKKIENVADNYKKLFHNQAY